MHRGILDGPDALELEDGRTLRLLSAMEVLQARRQARTMADEEKELALCSNACLIARALERDGMPVFRDGSHAMEELTAEQIASLAARWAQFNARVNPGPDAPGDRIEHLKNVWSTRRGRGCTGACCEPFQPCPRKTASDR